MGRLTRVIERIVNFTGHFSSWLVFVMMVLVLVEVLSRYGMRRPLMVGDEFSAYLLVALAFLGSAYTWKRGNHVRITVLAQRLSPRSRSWLRLATLIVAFVFTAAVSQAGYTFMKSSFRYHVSSSSFFRTPLQVPHLTVVLGFVILAMWLLVEIGRAISVLRGAEASSEGEPEEIGA